jgi:hypothetical protein
MRRRNPFIRYLIDFSISFWEGGYNHLYGCDRLKLLRSRPIATAETNGLQTVIQPDHPFPARIHDCLLPERIPENPHKTKFRRT